MIKEIRPELVGIATESGLSCRDSALSHADHMESM